MRTVYVEPIAGLVAGTVHAYKIRFIDSGRMIDDRAIVVNDYKNRDSFVATITDWCEHGILPTD